MNDGEIQSKILNSLSTIDSTWSNKLARELRVNKNKYTKNRNKLIEDGLITVEKEQNRMLLKLARFEAKDKYGDYDWTKITRENCTGYLQYLRETKPLFKITKKKKIRITKNRKLYLNAFFHELDRQMIMCIRFVNAEALGLIKKAQAESVQYQCIDFVKEYIKQLVNDHKEFKEEIKEYAQSQLRTVQFKI